MDNTLDRLEGRQAALFSQLDKPGQCVLCSHYVHHESYNVHHELSSVYCTVCNVHPEGLHLFCPASPPAPP